MKKTIAMAALAVAVSFGSVSCKKKVSDADLQTQATTIVTTNPNVSVEVKDGEAHLSGTFTTQQEKDAMINQLKAIPGIKNVHDMATVATVAPPPPPVKNTSAVAPEVQQRVQDAVKDIPGVKVEVMNGELTLTGTVSSKDARRVKESVDALKVGKVNYNYTVK